MDGVHQLGREDTHRGMLGGGESFNTSKECRGCCAFLLFICAPIMAPDSWFPAPMGHLPALQLPSTGLQTKGTLWARHQDVCSGFSYVLCCILPPVELGDFTPFPPSSQGGALACGFPLPRGHIREEDCSLHLQEPPQHLPAPPLALGLMSLSR